jgi:hypothetical protein
VALEFNPSAICVTKFYDANVNGYMDYGEQPLANVKFTLSGNANAVQYTDANGKTNFTGLASGNYTVTETLAKFWAATTPIANEVYLGPPVRMMFGNVCLGAGGAQGIGYWMNKNGQDKLNDDGSMEPELSMLRYLNLRKADGTDFDPYSYSQLKEWFKNANASNMAYMLSAQLAAMFLNAEAGYVNFSSIVHVPGCGLMGQNNFSYIWMLIYWQANESLMLYANTTAPHPQRSYQECLKNALDKANNNLSFVQQQPCTDQIIVTNRESSGAEINSDVASTMKVWPNPSGNYFNLQPSFSNEQIQLRVFDVNGRLVYTANGASNKTYRFGENLKAGVYMVEVLQGKNRTVQKLVKQ